MEISRMIAVLRFLLLACVSCNARLRFTDAEVKKLGLVAGQVEILSKLGGGADGVVYKGRNLSSGQIYAIKFEYSHMKKIAMDTKILGKFHGTGTVGFPKVYWHGKHDDYNAILLELVGDNLDTISSRYYPISLRNVLLLADQMITRLETLHNAFYVHGDVKPDNFALGRSDGKSAYGNDTVYLIDLGDARQIISRGADGSIKHVPFYDGVPVIQSYRYASFPSLTTAATSRRDDMESLGYSLISMMRPLPWQGIHVDSTTDKHKFIIRERIATSISELCAGLPEFKDYFSHVKALGFASKPDYSYLRRLFQRLYNRKKYSKDRQLNWNM